MSRHVLVVDDDPSILAMVCELLTDEGYPIATATNGQEALEAVASEMPSLVLLDMRMPKMDGWGFARALNERGISLPVVVMTAAENAKRWADEIGADGFVSKPFDVDDLLEAVHKNKKEHPHPH